MSNEIEHAAKTTPVSTTSPPAAIPIKTTLSQGRAEALDAPLPIAQRLPILAVDIPQCAEMIGVSDDTIRREIDRGRLRAVKIGRVWRIRISELEAYLRRSEVRNESCPE